MDNAGRLLIAKFPKGADVRSVPHGEVLAMTLAGNAGVYNVVVPLQSGANSKGASSSVAASAPQKPIIVTSVSGLPEQRTGPAVTLSAVPGPPYRVFPSESSALSIVEGPPRRTGPRPDS